MRFVGLKTEKIKKKPAKKTAKPQKTDLKTEDGGEADAGR